jgi:hypothetical protein
MAMKKIFICFTFGLTISTYAQVGIGTNTPHNSSQLEVSASTKGILFPRLTSAQRANIASPATGLYVWDTNTKSLWYFNGVVWVNTVSEGVYGDVKSGFQLVDHSGWILLNGRALNTLTASQQALAVSLGFTTNIPNASTAYLVQNGSGMGAVSGGNTVTLTQSNLPNVSFTGNAANAGNHSHTTDPAAFNSVIAGAHDHWVDAPPTGTSTNGWHSHGSNANGGNGAGLQFQDGNLTPTSVDYNDVGIEDNTCYTLALQIYGDGNHNHSVDIPGFWSGSNGNHSHSIDVPSTPSSAVSDHSHSVSVSSGGAAIPFNIAPKSLSVNMFVYLGL